MLKLIAFTDTVITYEIDLRIKRRVEIQYRKINK